MSDNAYTNQYLFSESADFYIHKHVQNIGRAMEGTTKSQTDLINMYNSKKSKVTRAVKNQYRDLFKRSIKKQGTSPQALKVLNEAIENKKDSVMSKLSKDLGKSFYQSLNIQKMGKLMQASLSLGNVNLQDIIREDRMVSVAEFDKILSALAEGYKLITNETAGKRLAEYLVDITNNQTGFISRESLGQNLLTSLNDMERQLQGITLSSLDVQQIKNIRKQIEPLGKGLRGDTSLQGIEKIANDIFSTGFAEAISSEIKECAYGSIIESIDQIILTGDKETQIKYTDTFGQYKNRGGESAAGKADVTFKNIKIHLKSTGNGNKNRTITITVGLSDKFYKGANFPRINQITRDERFSSGSGLKLREVLYMIFRANELQNLYLTYNTLAHGESLPSAYQALKQIIIQRDLVYMFGARGGNDDFAQYMFINGQIVSLWDIIISMTSFLGDQRENRKSPVTLEYKGKFSSNLKKAVKLSDTVERVRMVNSLINEVTIKGELSLNALKRYGATIYGSS